MTETAAQTSTAPADPVGGPVLVVNPTKVADPAALFDRVGLGVHYTSDVVGGWLIGLAVVCASTAAFGLGVRPVERDAGDAASGSARDPGSPA